MASVPAGDKHVQTRAEAYVRDTDRGDGAKHADDLDARLVRVRARERVTSEVFVHLQHEKGARSRRQDLELRVCARAFVRAFL